MHGQATKATGQMQVPPTPARGDGAVTTVAAASVAGGDSAAAAVERSRPAGLAANRRKRAAAPPAPERMRAILNSATAAAADISARQSAEEALRNLENEILRQSAQHLTIQEAERKRIAADLHDGLGQSLSLVHLAIEQVSSLLRAGNPEMAAECLDRLKPKIKETVEEVRRIAMNLRPATLDSLGVLATLAWYFRDLRATCPGISLEWDCSVAESDVPPIVKTPIFRIVQEASSNAVKHASGNRIKVGLLKDSCALELSVEDNGRGFDVTGVAGRSAWFSGLGLQSMRERAQLSRGTYWLDSAPGKGTRIRVRWPLPLLELEAGPDSGLPPLRNPGSDESAFARESGTPHDLPDRGGLTRRIDRIG